MSEIEVNFRGNMEEYVFQLHNIIPADVCNQAIEESKKLNWESNTFWDNKKEIPVNRSGKNEFQMSHEDFPSSKLIMEKVHDGITEYLNYLKYPWLGVKHVTGIRFNKYFENNVMAIHCDHIHSMFDGKIKGVPILSVVGVLNDDFEGGEFILFKDYEIKFKQGDIVIFPSNFMFPHKVKPVTKGIRYSIINWAC